MHLYIIVSGETFSVDINDAPSNIHIIRRPNQGYDYAAFAEAVQHIKSRNVSYQYYFFLNSSAAGPFIPEYAKTKINWTNAYMDVFQRDPHIKVVGSTICIDSILDPPNLNPMVQTYAFMMDHECFEWLYNEKFWEEACKCLSKYDAICMFESRLSRDVLANGWRISCLVPEYANLGIDYKNITYDPNPQAQQHHGDIVYPGKLCFGRDIHPYEVVFVKTNRLVSSDEIQSLMRQQGV